MFSKRFWGLVEAISIALATNAAYAGAPPFGAGSLSGNYLFNVVGGSTGYNQDNITEVLSDFDEDLNLGSLALNGVLRFNGAGKITFGDLRVAFGDDTFDQVNCTPTLSTTLSTYTVGSDGTGTITLVFTDTTCLSGDTINFTTALSRAFSGDHQVNTTHAFSTTDTNCFVLPDHELSVGDDSANPPFPACVDGAALAGIFHHQ